MVVKSKDTEIKITDLIKLLLLKKRFILIVVIVFFFLGIFISCVSKKVYTAKTVFVLTNQSSSPLSRFSTTFLPNLMNLDRNTGNILSPEIYDDIIRSYPFKKDLLSSNVVLENLKDSTTFFSYFKENYRPGFFSVLKKYTIGLPSLIFSSIKKIFISKNNLKQSNINLRLQENNLNQDITSLKPEESSVYGLVNKLIIIELNKNSNSVVLKAEYNNPIIAAQLAQTTYNILEKRIRTFQTQKENEKVKFIEELKAEYKQKFQDTQFKLARHTDYNQNLRSAIGNTRTEKLQAEYEHLKFIYNDIVQQLEKARIKLKEDSHVFTVIEPVSIPLSKSRPKRAFIITTAIVLGFVVSVSYIFFRKYVLSEFTS